MEFSKTIGSEDATSNASYARLRLPFLFSQSKQVQKESLSMSGLTKRGGRALLLLLIELIAVISRSVSPAGGIERGQRVAQ